MNDLIRYKNNILYITKDTKLPKSAYNSSFVPINNLPIKQRKIYINNSEEKKTNEKNNKIFLSISNIKPLSNHQRILTFNNNKDKIYNYKFLPRKNIMHIKSYSSQKENFPLTSYSSKKNVSISYTSPKKIQEYIFQMIQIIIQIIEKILVISFLIQAMQKQLVHLIKKLK